MGAPAIVMGDRITGTCPSHMIPSASGAPAPAGPLPFNAPITMSTVATVMIGGKPAAVVGSQGLNTPPHPGIVDPPFAAPPMQMGRIVAGSPSVLIGGQPAASATSTCTCCVAPGTLVPSVTTVLIG
jgi:uncharacterized Zn-binding protein involved in type VI secretion